MKIIPWFHVATLAGLSALSLAATAQTNSAPVAASTTIATAPVVLSAAGASYTLDGVVQAVKQSTVAAQASGRIASLLVKAGDKVRAGQLLATIDDREAQVGMQQSQAQINQADAALRNALANKERTADLQSKGFISKAAMDTAELQYKSAQAQRDQALAGGRQAGISQSFTKVTAPFDGWVLQTLAEAGDLAVPGKPLVTVYAPQPLRAVVQVPASRNAAVRESKSISILVQTNGDAVQTITPSSRSEIPSSDPVSQTSEWRFDLPAQTTAALMPGQQVRVQFGAPVDKNTSTLMLVPSAAIVRRGELTAVYVTSGQGFALRAIRTGQSQGSSGVEVLSGVRVGDVVALDPVGASRTGATAGSLPAKTK